MIALIVPLAHAGPGSSWQAVLVVASVVLAGFLLAAATGLYVVDRPDALIAPFATAAVAGSLGLLAQETLSDWVGAAVPVAVVCALVLLIGGLTGVELRLPSALTMGGLALAVVGAVVLSGPLARAMHPAVELLPLSDDAAVTIVEPDDGATADGDGLEVRVSVDGGSVGAGTAYVDDPVGDPEEAGALLVALGEVEDGEVGVRELVDVAFAEACSATEPCTEVTFTLEPGPGTWEVTAELARADGTPLAPPVRERIVVEVP